MTLRVYEVVHARPVTSGWVRRALGPTVAALRFRAEPPPLEFSVLPRGCGGMADISSPDGRVHVSKAALTFWTDFHLARVYTHEVVHRLCFSRGDTGHGPVFFATLAVLSRRLDIAFPPNSSVGSHLLRLNLYDFQDSPAELAAWPCDRWAPVVIRFALTCANELAEKDLAAEDVPTTVAERWRDCLAKLLADDGVQASQAAVLRLELEETKREVETARRAAVAARSPSRILAVLERNPEVFAAAFVGVVVGTQILNLIARLVLLR